MIPSHTKKYEENHGNPLGSTSKLGQPNQPNSTDYGWIGFASQLVDPKGLPGSHSQMEHYFFSYLPTWKVDLIEILEIMAQMWQYVIFFSLKPTKVTSDFILN